MKKVILPVLVVIIGFSCSTPKNYYMFNKSNFDYNSPEKVKPVVTQAVENDKLEIISEESIVSSPDMKSPLILDQNQLETQVAFATDASSEVNEPVVFSKETYKAMSKAEKKETRKAIKKELKNYIKNMKAAARGEKVEATHDLNITGYTRIGVILAAAGIVLMILTSGTVSQLGSLLVLIGVIFILIDLL